MMNRDHEIREAIDAGARALNSLRMAHDYLDSARNWGLLDMFGGSFISTMLKHSKMDEAKQCIERAQQDLQCFSDELRDVDLPGIEIGGFLGFADYFFDGFPADFMVQRKINRAREQVDRAVRQVEELLRQLRAM